MGNENRGYATASDMANREDDNANRPPNQYCISNKV